MKDSRLSRRNFIWNSMAASAALLDSARSWAWVATHLRKPVVYDPYFASVVALLHCDGTNGSTSFVDQLGHSITANGAAAISTAASKFGGASAIFNGSTSQLSIPQNTDFAFGTGDFTVELWINWSAVTTAHFIGLHAWGVASNWCLYYTGGSLRVNLNSVDQVSYTWTPTTATWYHIAFVRTSGTVLLFVNGAQCGSGSFATSIASSYNLTLGATTNNLSYFSGYLDDIRITKGIARYTSNFSAPTAPFPNHG